MTQINLEFGTEQSISYKEPRDASRRSITSKQWIDIASQYGCPRVMINQQQTSSPRRRETAPSPP